MANKRIEYSAGFETDLQGSSTYLAQEIQVPDDSIAGIDALNVQDALAELQGDIDGLNVGLATKANSADVYTQSEVDSEIDAAILALQDSAPTNLNTLKELADAIDNDANFHNSVGAALALKANADSPVLDGPVDMEELGGDPASPSSGRRKFFSKSDGLYEKDSSGKVRKVGAGAGSGEINVIESSSDSTNWVASGGGIAVATSSSASDLPLGGVVTTSIKITPSSGSDYVRYRWQMPEALKNRKLKIEWHQRPLSGYASGDLKVELFKNAASDYSGAYTEFALSTDSSGDSPIPNANGKFSTYFDADGGDYYELRIVRVTGSTALNLANVIVGPGVQPQGAVVGEWINFTPTGSWTTNTTYTGRYRRVGTSLDLQVHMSLSGTPNASSLSVNLPSGLTIDSSAIASSSSSRIPFGHVIIRGGGSNSYVGRVDYVHGFVSYLDIHYVAQNTNTDTTINRSLNLVSSTAPESFGSGAYLAIEVKGLPIAEWAGSGTLNVAQNDVEYAWNSSTSDANDTTSFGYGPGGAPFPGNLTALRTKTVRFQTPIQPTDRLVLEIYDPTTGGKWVDVSSGADSGGTNFGIEFQNTNSYGMCLRQNLANTADISVQFGRYSIASGATYGAAGNDWSVYSTRRWRVVKHKAGVPVGFGTVSSASSGLMPADHSKLDNAAATRLGLKSYQHGTNYNGGNAPTIAYNSGGGSLSSVSLSEFIPYQMQDGSWRMRFNIGIAVSSVSRTHISISVNGVTFSNSQPVAGYSSSTIAVKPFVNGSESNIYMNHSTDTTTFYAWSGDVKLVSKPTWAY